MSLRRAMIVSLASCGLGLAVGQTTLLSRVERALDMWSGRAATRDAILKIDHDAGQILTTIAKSKKEVVTRRSHAIALLATFNTAESENTLNHLTNDSNPRYRCLALQSLVELESRDAFPVLIRKLDDKDVCMTAISTDPAAEHEVYVSDEAVRLLEQITGESFNQELANRHRATKPWKEWWAQQKNSSKPSS